jgi:nucleoid-associated protein YgaU
MRKAQTFLFLLFSALGGYLGYYGLQAGWFDALLKQEAPKQTAQNLPPEKPAEKEEFVRPTFDIVRTEPTGEIVIAGRSAPGWTVTVESNGKAIGTAVADAEGQWVIQPDKPLPQGEHALELKAQDPKKARSVFSKQRIALSLGATNKSQPLVALTEEGKATRILQMQNADMAGALNPTHPDPTNQVSIATIDYEDADGRNTMHMTGHASPGSRVMLYVENELAGTAMADTTGKWDFSAIRTLANKSHAIRADMVDATGERVIARAEVRFDREPQQVATADAKPAGTANQTRSAQSSADTSQRSGSSAGTTLHDSDGHVITIRRGDTLWQIAKRHYGSGEKYTQIFENNRNQIRNPNLIYPKQRFSIPSK